MSRKKRKANKFAVDEYLYSVGWSGTDNVFVGRVAEFSLLAAHGATLEAALAEIKSVVGLVLDDLAESGEEAPVPLSRKAFSGKLNLRMPKSLHRQLSIAAAQQGVSLNQLINARLASQS
ncbi:MAG: toxin-antitoxin system HicB family antitoxin [Pyrinomonadaceae bacterium MAG19_C2-C3]|nr:toxin-antitoxin system HicB family antitoxin [Pyrinomonadaceae bacterium MAG19_C2-C3]